MKGINFVLHAIVIFAAGFMVGGAWFTDTMAPAMTRKGFEQGRKLVDWKKLALSDKTVTNGICNAWWFMSDHKDRRLKP